MEKVSLLIQTAIPMTANGKTIWNTAMVFSKKKVISPMKANGKKEKIRSVTSHTKETLRPTQNKVHRST